jgi:hypothetical protein
LGWCPCSRNGFRYFCALFSTKRIFSRGDMIVCSYDKYSVFECTLLLVFDNTGWHHRRAMRVSLSYIRTLGPNCFTLSWSRGFSTFLVLWELVLNVNLLKRRLLWERIRIKDVLS